MRKWYNQIMLVGCAGCVNEACWHQRHVRPWAKSDRLGGDLGGEDG